MWIERIERLLVERGPMSVKMIAAATGLSYNWSLRYVWKLKELRRIYIVKWIREGSEKMTRPVAYYATGNKKDKPKPRPLTSAEVSRKRRADPVKHALELARRRAKDWKPKQTDPLVAALFGRGGP